MPCPTLCFLHYTDVHAFRHGFQLSTERKTFHGQGISTSRFTSYNPKGSGQCERYNGILWRAIILALKTQRLLINQWDKVLPQGLHSIRTLLLISRKVTPHERLFNFPGRPLSVCSILTWLSTPGKVLLKQHIRQSKNETAVEEVELIEANHRYAHIRLHYSNETTVSHGDITWRGRWCKWRCPWCNDYRRRKWTRRHEFKSWTRLIAFHIALIPLGKVWIQLFSLQLWVNRFFSFGGANSLEEGKLWIETC